LAFKVNLAGTQKASKFRSPCKKSRKEKSYQPGMQNGKNRRFERKKGNRK